MPSSVLIVTSPTFGKDLQGQHKEREREIAAEIWCTQLVPVSRHLNSIKAYIFLALVRILK
eukprot:snap_masked-scaffold_3-processed-gene-11.24-mRNA-1 protein AED:1.00 eAED:1.00 QI:0/-1/0/0/-1/1/1/0/60